MELAQVGCSQKNKMKNENKNALPLVVRSDHLSRHLSSEKPLVAFVALAVHLSCVLQLPIAQSVEKISSGNVKQNTVFRC